MSLPDLHLDIYKLSVLYAQAMDERRADLIEAIFTQDGVIEGVDFKIDGRPAIAKMASTLGGRENAIFGKTLHYVMNHTAEVSGDRAKGTAYCIAYHILKERPASALIWYIRYYDDYIRAEGEWRIAHRQLVLEFTQTLPVVPGPTA
jgi:hypothetical protein